MSMIMRQRAICTIEFLFFTFFREVSFDRKPENICKNNFLGAAFPNMMVRSRDIGFFTIIV